MDSKPNTWTFIATAIMLILCGVWAYYDYSLEPDKVPFEPIIACLASLFALMGYVLYKRKSISTDAENTVTQQASETHSAPKIEKSEPPKEKLSNPTIAQKAKKIYNINQIDKADFS